MSPQQSGQETFLKKLSSLILTNLENEQFGVSELAREMGMSRSNLHRKVNSATGKSVSQFIRELRLEKAMELLKQGEFTASEIAYRVGFGSATYFSKCFHDHFGFPPGEAAEHDAGESIHSESPPEHQIPESDKRRLPLPWLITILTGIVAVILLVIMLKPFSRISSDADPVIAVLPFHNDSPDQENAYIVNGLMEEILNKLSLVEELNVVSRTSAEAYRDSDKSLREIGRELQASHILEGSATILDKRTRIRLQLIETETDRHLWSKPYEREISLENLFEVQEEVALAVTGELRIVLNREEKEQIFAVPSKNLEAYEAFLKARELINLMSIEGDDDYSPREMSAKKLLERAIELDPNFPGSYIQLANIYINRFYYHEKERDLSRAFEYLDLGKFLVEKAISLYESESEPMHPKDGAYNWANGLMAEYYLRKGMYDKAHQFREESFKGYWIPYLRYRTNTTWYSQLNQYYPAIENYVLYVETKPDEMIVPSYIHTQMYETYCGAGFPELARQLSEQMLLREEDGQNNYLRMRDMEKWQGSYAEAIESLEWLTGWDTVFDWKWWLEDMIWSYTCMGEIDQAIHTTQQGMTELMQKGEELEDGCILGYVYMITGEQEKAIPLLEADKERLITDLEYPTRDTQLGYTHIHLARVYSILGDKENTLANLAPLRDIPGVHIRLITELRDWPSYDLVRDTREFKEIYGLLEKRYQKEHKRIAGLLESKNSLLH